MRTAAVPSFVLYGETGRSRFPDVLHCETIPERSRLHDWRIRPHRHADVTQFFVIVRGGARASIEGVEREIAAGTVLAVPALRVHGFAFAPETEGLVVSVPDVELAAALGGDGAGRIGRVIEDRPESGEFARLAALFERLDGEYRGRARGRAVALRALVGLIGLHFLRLEDAGTAAPEATVPALVGAFLDLVEARHREQPGVAELAAELGITPTHLTRLTRAHLGRGALEILHDRLVLEAQRDLVYTSLTLAEIAGRLGFSDASWFSKFFKAKVGMAPSAYRGESLLRD